MYTATPKKNQKVLYDIWVDIGTIYTFTVDWNYKSIATKTIVSLLLSQLDHVWRAHTYTGHGIPWKHVHFQCNWLLHPASRIPSHEIWWFPMTPGLPMEEKNELCHKSFPSQEMRGSKFNAGITVLFFIFRNHHPFFGLPTLSIHVMIPDDLHALQYSNMVCCKIWFIGNFAMEFL